MYALYKAKKNGTTLQFCLDQSMYSINHKSVQKLENFKLMSQFKKRRKEFIKELAKE